MQVVIDWHEKINYTATIEVDLDTLRAYWEKDIGITIDGHIPDWMIRGYLRDQREVWAEQIDTDDARSRIINFGRTLDEINVIS